MIWLNSSMVKSGILIGFLSVYEHCFPLVLFVMLIKVVLTFESVDEILRCDHSNESYYKQISQKNLYVDIGV